MLIGRIGGVGEQTGDGEGANAAGHWCESCCGADDVWVDISRYGVVWHAGDADIDESSACLNMCFVDEMLLAGGTNDESGLFKRGLFVGFWAAAVKGLYVRACLFEQDCGGGAHKGGFAQNNGGLVGYGCFCPRENTHNGEGGCGGNVRGSAYL